ncbi:hypothetical protein TOPH_05333 [Tolypocladium ophioglossoides CBS 100239]|uniref:Uncharacterized protein n=1 Tax=Tolypocladium ophioglossoides (strain CBS 100239) TaxID=1163406 RepID=A0A0L0N7U0_TOLOC|nr:hypothetical protein TOPH_05333 [Tolypocladium ophioglossoides CBS 100239]
MPTLASGSAQSTTWWVRRSVGGWEANQVIIGWAGGNQVVGRVGGNQVYRPVGCWEAYSGRRWAICGQLQAGNYKWNGGRHTRTIDCKLLSLYIVDPEVVEKACASGARGWLAGNSLTIPPLSLLALSLS